MLLVKERQPSIIEEARPSLSSDEVVAFCPACKAFQTLWFTGTRMTPTRKFSQHGEQVYHDCGSKEPCRLYRTV